MDVFAKRLQQLLEEKEMTQRELAARAQVTDVTISRYLSGERKPRIEIINKIAEVLNVTTDYLLGRSDEKNPYNKKTLSSEEKYPDVTDVEEAMEILLNQPGLMLKGEALDDEDKIILANAIQAGLRMADEIRKKRKEQEKEDDDIE